MRNGRRRVCAIGCGDHARLNIWPNLANAGLELVGVCASRLPRARLAADRAGISHAFDDPAQMLDALRPDGVIVVVPTDAYAKTVPAAIEAGIATFCEKPAGSSAAATMALAEMAERAGVSVVVGYQRRFSTAYERLQETSTNDQLGPPNQASFKWSMGPLRRGTPLREWILENPVHHFDLARLLLGEIDAVAVEAATTSNSQHAISVTGRSATGALFTMTMNTLGSWSHHSERVELYGPGGSAMVDNADTVVFRPHDSAELTWRPNYPIPLPQHSTTEICGFARELRHFRDVVEGSATSISDLRSAANTLQLASSVAEQAERSAATGWQLSPIDDRSPASVS